MYESGNENGYWRGGQILCQELWDELGGEGFCETVGKAFFGAERGVGGFANWWGKVFGALKRGLFLFQ